MWYMNYKNVKFSEKKVNHLRFIQLLRNLLKLFCCVLQESLHQQSRGRFIQQPQNCGHVAIGHNEV